ncbi:hypothetical protein [Endozoicomonas euniceicola]|uniref:Uncharacterized protein n=1 Tax=Endozoicomonas euniceicola TaxID=1234143 RepID=A0ABY6GUQ5_9GAMM|nr:hypothetical protein [Endozoicomonas euniceicola]UYM16512.1 hypothetical protein NX720_00835 [Endozoicomonas euniceicola]
MDNLGSFVHDSSKQLMIYDYDHGTRCDKGKVSAATTVAAATGSFAGYVASQVAKEGGSGTLFAIAGGVAGALGVGYLCTREVSLKPATEESALPHLRCCQDNYKKDQEYKDKLIQATDRLEATKADLRPAVEFEQENQQRAAQERYQREQKIYQGKFKATIDELKRFVASVKPESLTDIAFDLGAVLLTGRVLPAKKTPELLAIEAFEKQGDSGHQSKKKLLSALASVLKTDAQKKQAELILSGCPEKPRMNVKPGKSERQLNRVKQDIAFNKCRLSEVKKSIQSVEHRYGIKNNGNGNIEFPELPEFYKAMPK